MRPVVRVLCILCALCACAAASAGAAQPETPSPRVLFYQGLYQEIARGDLEAAITAYRVLRGATPAGNELAAEALIREGICLEKMGRDREAFSCYDRAIAQSPDSAAVVEKAFSEMAIFFSRPAMVHARDKELDGLKEEAGRCIEKGDHAGARDRFRKALLIDPDNHELQLRMAAVCRRLGEYRDAAFYYTMATGAEKYGNDPAVLRELASCYRALDDYDSAIKLWRAYLEGESLGTRKRNMVAYEIELLLEAKEAADPDTLPRGLADLLAQAEAQSRKETYRAASATYQTARAQFPRSYLPPLRLGVLFDYLLENAGKYTYLAIRPGSQQREEIAASYYEEAINKAPLVTAQRLRCRLALLYENGHDLEKASYHMAQYFSHDIRPVENDGVIMERIRKKLMRDRIRRMREKP